MKTDFYLKSFKDFENKDRTLIVAAVTENVEVIPMEDSHFGELITDLMEDFNGCDCSKHLSFECPKPLVKRVRFGISICMAEDMPNFDVELGKRIAIGRALKDSSKLGEIIYSSGMLAQTGHIRTCLERYAEIISENPERFSKPYAKAKAKFDKENEK